MSCRRCHQLVLALRYVDELSVEEISRALNEFSVMPPNHYSSVHAAALASSHGKRDA